MFKRLKGIKPYNCNFFSIGEPFQNNIKSNWKHVINAKIRRSSRHDITRIIKRLRQIELIKLLRSNIDISVFCTFKYPVIPFIFSL